MRWHVMVKAAAKMGGKKSFGAREGNGSPSSWSGGVYITNHTTGQGCDFPSLFLVEEISPNRTSWYNNICQRRLPGEQNKIAFRTYKCRGQNEWIARKVDEI